MKLLMDRIRSILTLRTFVEKPEMISFTVIYFLTDPKSKANEKKLSVLKLTQIDLIVYQNQILLKTMGRFNEKKLAILIF